uniref:Uncharacterized protein n=1 Tax=Onchocerca volvulus TaxID=6282 RepID=A0A8R1XR04_ONCVO
MFTSKRFNSQINDKATATVQSSKGDRSAIWLIMAANKFKNRQEGRRRQTKKKSQINEKPNCLPQPNVPDTNLQVIHNLPDDNNFTGPISAEALMEECEESDSSNPTTLPSFPVQQDANHCCLQQSHPFALSSKGAPTTYQISNHIQNDLPVIREVNWPGLINNIPRQSAAPARLSTSTKIPKSSQRSRPNIISRTNSVKAKFTTQLTQKYDHLNFVKIQKAASKLNKNTVDDWRLKKKNVLFLPESEYSVIEMPDDPNTTTVGFFKKFWTLSGFLIIEEERKKQLEKLPPRVYDFFLGPTTSRPIGSVNARSFCESCDFMRGDIRNWLIVGSRFDRLNENIFDVKKNGCPKTRLSHANYPPIHFRILSDALTNIFINVAGLKIFLAVGEDWIVKKSIIPEEFTSFVKRFAGVLFDLYVKQYTSEYAKEMEFTEDLGKIKIGYAYVEMPTISDPDMEMKCIFYNNAIRELVQNWDATSTSPYYHKATKQCIELKLIDWRQICIKENAISNNSMITILMKHLMEEWGICVAPTNRP